MGLMSINLLPNPVWLLHHKCTSAFTLPHGRSSGLPMAVSAAELGQEINVVAKSESELLACPICFEALTRKGPDGLNRKAISRSSFQCASCKKSYPSIEAYLDLTIASSLKNYQESLPSGTEIFRNPFVSFVYERGWRQSFARSGFPGPDKEFNMAQKILDPAAGGVLVDVSCGSGLFARRFIKSNTYKAVIASDFSENMLRQCYAFLKEDRSFDKLNLALVRADVARLPFVSQSVDAVHAGAAMHCWPTPSVGVAEITRILKPQGVFVATTFLTSSPIRLLLNDLWRPNSTIRYWTESELEDLCMACGLVNFKKITKGNFIMFSARKPD